MSEWVASYVIVQWKDNVGLVGLSNCACIMVSIFPTGAAALIVGGSDVSNKPLVGVFFLCQQCYYHFWGMWTPSYVHSMLAFSNHNISLQIRFKGVFAEKSSGAITFFPQISMGTGSMRVVIWCFPEKPTVLTDDCERGRLEPSFPMQEYIAPVSTIKVCSCFLMITGMVGSLLGCTEMTGSIPLRLWLLLLCPGWLHPQHMLSLDDLNPYDWFGWLDGDWLNGCCRLDDDLMMVGCMIAGCMMDGGGIHPLLVIYLLILQNLFV